MCVDLGYEVPNKIIAESKVVEKVENVFCKSNFGVANELSKIYILLQFVPDERHECIT